MRIKSDPNQGNYNWLCDNVGPASYKNSLSDYEGFGWRYSKVKKIILTTDTKITQTKDGIFMLGEHRNYIDEIHVKKDEVTGLYHYERIYWELEIDDDKLGTVFLLMKKV